MHLLADRLVARVVESLRMFMSVSIKTSISYSTSLFIAEIVNKRKFFMNIMHISWVDVQ